MTAGYRLRGYGILGPGSGRIVAEPVLPTPRLLAEGYRLVEAYESDPASEAGGVGGRGHAAIWRVRDDAYDPPGTKYTRVTVERIPYVWTCDDCGRTWTDVEEMGATFEAYARHRCDR